MHVNIEHSHECKNVYTHACQELCKHNFNMCKHACTHLCTPACNHLCKHMCKYAFKYGLLLNMFASLLVNLHAIQT